MIRNFVFDPGNVLISFRPARLLEINNYPADIPEKILADVFKSYECFMPDNGNIIIPEATESISNKSSLKREYIARIFNKRTEIMFSPRRILKSFQG